MASNARNLSKLLGTSTQVPTTALPQAIADLETVGQTLSGGEIAPSSIKSNTLTQSFDSNQAVTFNMADSIDAVSPIVSVFKEVPQQGFSSKGQWDVNANATNYEFFDEKPISYSSATLTPSATGDGTFTSSNPVVSGYSFSNFAYDSVTQATGRSGNNEAIKFNNNGTKLYLVSDGGPDGVYQYSLSTAYDISTLSYDNVSFSITQDSSPRDISFNADGTKMFILGVNNKTIYRYGLTTGFDLSTASYDSVSLSVNYGTASPMGFLFNGNATKLYVIIAGGGNSGDSTVYERQLPGAYDISSATAVSSFNYDESDLPGSLTEAYASRGLFNNDGTKMYLQLRMPDLSRAIIEYNLSTAYDLSTISRASIQSLTTGTGNPGDDNRGMAWNGDGTKLITLTEPGNLFRFTSSASTAFSSSDVGKKVVGNSGSAIITSAAGAYTSVTPFANTSAISSWQLFGAQGKSDGSGIELSGYSVAADIVFPTGASGSGASMVYSNNVSPTSSAFNNLRNVVFNPTGTIALVMTSGNIQRWNLSTAFDLATMTEATGDNFSGQLNTTQYGLAVSPDGTKLFVGDHGNDLIKQFTLSTAWSPSTESYNGYYYFNNGGNWNSFTGADGVPSTTNFNPFSFQFNSDGTKMITIMYDNAPYHSVVEFALSTGFDMSTMSYTSFANFDGTVNPQAIVISPDGLKIMMHGDALGNTGTEVYALGSVFSVGNSGNSLTKTSGTIDLSSLTGNTNAISYGGLQMSSDGKRMWAIYSGDNKFYEITGGTTSVHPYSTYSPALTNSSTGQINSSSWLDINSMTADETKNDGDIFYAVSTDNRTSWGVANASDGVRKIARNNSGTWQYNNHAGTNNPWQYNSGAASGNTLTISSAFNYGSWLSGGGTHTSANVKFSPDGTKIFWAPSGGNSDADDIYTANLSTAWDLSTATQGPVYTEYSSSGWGQGSFAFNSDGTKLYTVVRASTGSATRTVRQWSLSTAYDVSTSSYVGASSSIGNYGHRGLYVAPDESYFITVDLSSGQTYIKKWNLATAGDITSTLTGETAVDVTTYTNWSNPAVGSFYTTVPDFFDSGNKMVIVNHGSGGSNTNDAYLIELSTAYDITSGTVIGKFTATTGSDLKGVGVKPDGTKLYAPDGTGGIVEFNTGAVNYETSETWVNGTNNNEHATLQEALGAQAFNRMNKAQLDAVADNYHFSQDSADTLDLMIAPYAASGTSPVSDGVTINYDAEALIREAIPGTDYIAEFPNPTTLNITAVGAANLKIRAQ